MDVLTMDETYILNKHYCVELDYKLQNYDWGKNSKESMVYNLKVHSMINQPNKLMNLNDEIAYAELWLGCHKNGHSLCILDELKGIVSLNELIYIWNGGDINDMLPFLMKVLSVKNNLSIQIHPNKTSANNLNMLLPSMYPDNNHKPEMAIALTEFYAFIGFMPLSKFYHLLDHIPCLKEYVNTCLNDLEPSDSKYKVILQKLAKEKKIEIEILIKNILKIVEENPLLFQHDKNIEYFIKLNNYSDDFGRLVILMMNFVHLKPFQALEISPNIPHVYVFGDCIECMACSDNVIRLGLTTKFCDVENMLKLIDCNDQSSLENDFTPRISQINNYTTCYYPQFHEFMLIKLQIDVNDLTDHFLYEQKKTESIIIIIKGELNVNIQYEDSLNKQSTSSIIKWSVGKAFILRRNCKVFIEDKQLNESFLAFAATKNIQFIN